MNKIPNRKAICDVLLKEAETDKDIVVLAVTPEDLHLWHLPLYGSALELPRSVSVSKQT